MNDNSTAPTGLDLFVKVMAHITVHPQDWRQEWWMGPASTTRTTCGTTGCIAGWACTFHGLTNEVGKLKDPNADFGEEAKRLFELDSVHVGAAGDSLFACNNDMDDLYFLAADLFEVLESELRDRVKFLVAEEEFELAQRAAKRAARRTECAVAMAELGGRGGKATP